MVFKAQKESFAWENASNTRRDSLRGGVFTKLEKRRGRWLEQDKVIKKRERDGNRSGNFNIILPVS